MCKWIVEQLAKPWNKRQISTSKLPRVPAHRHNYSRESMHALQPMAQIMSVNTIMCANWCSSPCPKEKLFLLTQAAWSHEGFLSLFLNYIALHELRPLSTQKNCCLTFQHQERKFNSLSKNELLQRRLLPLLLRASDQNIYQILCKLEGRWRDQVLFPGKHRHKLLQVK